jgi:hypothetical protein
MSDSSRNLYFTAETSTSASQGGVYTYHTSNNLKLEKFSRADYLQRKIVGFFVFRNRKRGKVWF